MAKKEYDTFDIMTGKFVGESPLDNFIEDMQVAQAEFEIVKAILEHHFNPVKTESVD